MSELYKTRQALAALTNGRHVNVFSIHLAIRVKICNKNADFDQIEVGARKSVSYLLEKERWKLNMTLEDSYLIFTFTSCSTVPVFPQGEVDKNFQKPGTLVV